jgi:nucleoside-diphosphate-sugar epimerase
LRALLTGASGFLGSQAARRLAENGFELVAVGRRRSELEDPAIRFVEADLTDPASLRAARASVGQVEKVVHLAALVPKTPADDEPGPMYATNVEGTLNLLTVFGDDVEGIVYGSTAEIYGLPEGSKPLTESVPPSPPSWYAATKLAGEYVCRAWSTARGVPACILRFSVIYGPADTINRALPNFIERALAEESLEVFGGEELRDYLSIEDAADAVALAAQRTPSGSFNIGSGKGVTVRAAAEHVVQLTGSAAGIDVLPRRKPAADMVLSIEQARVALGYEPRRFFPEGLDQQIHWQAERRRSA